MGKTIVVVGYGPGISNAVAERFGAAGFAVALVARHADKLAAAVKQLEAKQVRAAGFVADAGDPAAVRRAVERAREAHGPVTVLHWNVATPMAGDLLTAPPEELVTTFRAGVVGLVSAVQAALPDLRQQPDAAVLITNGGFGLFADAIDAMAVQARSMGLSVANAAKHKVSRMLAKQLEPEKIFVAEIMVVGTVKGTAWDRGQATLEASAIGDRFWQLYAGDRSEHLVQLSS
jgi:NAD(P)-dependent dehydrogenase (short-subunit alcohol dehydrogenase family)